MLETYKATLRGNRLEWADSTPPHLSDDTAVEVFVTILEKEPTSQGCQMAAVLEKLAALPAMVDIEDPAIWERETRQDRALPEKY